MRQGGWLRVITAVAFALVVTTGAVRAEDYVLGPEDVVQVSVWLHPELERSITVNADGNVIVPPVGEIKAGGLTAKQLGERVADRLSAYLRQTTTVTVTVTQFLSRSVYVTGAVAKPGRYGSEQMLGVIDVLNQAGGALPGSDLASVQVIRREGDVRRVMPADVSASLRDGDTSRLPVLKPGDMIVVPGGMGGAAGSTPAGDGVAVLGMVARPGYYPAGQGLDLWTALALAGGTTERARFKDVRLLSRGEGGITVQKVDLQSVLDRGARAPVTVKAGDVIVVMDRGPSAWNAITTVLGLSRDALNIAVLVDYFKGQNNNN